MLRLLGFLRIRDLPPLTQPNCAAELRHMSLWGVVIGAAEASMVSVVASKTFGASRLLTTIVWALPLLVNVFNLAWATVIQGRPRKPVFLLIAGGGLLAIASTGLTSSHWRPWGGWAFAAQVGLTHFFLSGLVTVRTTIWRANYPQELRAQIASRLQTLNLLISVLTSAALSLVFNRRPEYYRLVYPAVALLGALSLLPLRRLRIRGERASLGRFWRRAQLLNGNGQAALGLRASLAEGLAILRRDRLFAEYMQAQFLLGSANFFTDPILVNLLTKEVDFDYFGAQSLMYLLPVTVLLLSIQFWAPLFDGAGVLRFRVYNSLCWTASYGCTLAAVAMLHLGTPPPMIPAMATLFIGRMLNGVARGGGTLAWNLGHLHFAPEEQTEIYMSIHVALTGVRGLLMPLLGWWCYSHLGWGSLAIALLLASVASAMFARAARAARRCGPTAAASGS